MLSPLKAHADGGAGRAMQVIQEVEDRFWPVPLSTYFAPLMGIRSEHFILKNSFRMFLSSPRPFDYRRWLDDKCIRDTNGKWTHGWVQTTYAKQKQVQCL